MPTSGYAHVAENRHRELKTRLALAAILCVVALGMAPTIWPVVWLGAVVVTQGVDWLTFRSIRLHPDRRPGRVRRVLYQAVVALNVAVYSGLAAYLWFAGGEAGRAFAMIQTAGGLLHVSLHMHQHRSLLFAAATPHAMYLIGLPIAGAVIDRQPSDLLIAVAGVLYLMHLVVSVRQTSRSTQALQAANATADEARHAAEEASAAKSDFLAVISHEIRTPMNAVISAANLLRRTRLDSDQREHVSMLLDAGDLMMGLLNDVLDFSKIEAGQMTFEAAEMDIETRLTGLRRLWEPKARANGVRMTVEMTEDAPRLIRTDPLRIQQILFNLVSNAVKFTDRGRIEVLAAWRAERSEMIFSVRDTGVGIPADRLEHVFSSFQQAEAGTTRRFGGTGLGLTISRRLAEMMGGTLTVESQVGVGSVFTLTLPVEAIGEAAAAPAERAVETISLQGRSILAADDHEVNRRILALLLEPHGCRLTFAVNGAEAVDLAGVERFDAVLMDMQMPVMDGLEATRRIRQGGLNAATPVIALTANAMDVHKAAWDAAGVHAFLTKPIDPVLLAQTLGEAAAGRLEAAAA